LFKNYCVYPLAFSIARFNGGFLIMRNWRVCPGLAGFIFGTRSSAAQLETTTNKGLKVKSFKINTKNLQ